MTWWWTMLSFPVAMVVGVIVGELRQIRRDKELEQRLFDYFEIVEVSPEAYDPARHELEDEDAA